ncbi:MAG TPA: hypothetical protein VL361_11615 [Candidatus Limnocylindrales bacterium]|jgi:hypothetical protein|nr:hypothetical protein [Candidatus Limnocylindrales bacterium]
MEAQTMTAGEPTPADSNQSGSFSFSTYLLSFAAGLIIYVLSPGPVAKCFAPAGPPLPQVCQAAYAPLGFCCDHFPAVNRFYEWYMKDVWRLP